MQDNTFLEYLDGLYGYAIVLSRNQSQAEDLVQETYLRAIAKMRQLRQDSNVKSWLFTILRNIWLNQLRKRKIRGAVEEWDEEKAGMQASGSADPYRAHVSSVEQEQVRKAIQQLPVHFREVIVLREYEELSYQEIAAMLKVPVGTVTSRLARARSQLREVLGASSLFAIGPQPAGGQSQG
jgi:RNA polymerase sigma-70 factor (ECF subfamily)